MIPGKNITALKTLYYKLLGIDWRLTGSMNLALQGVDIEAKDIDIMIRVKDIQAVQDALRVYCKKQIEYSQNGGWSSFFGQFNIEGVQIDVMAGEVEKDGVKTTTNDVFVAKPQIVEVDGMAIPCLDLETEYEAYFSLDRQVKAELIKAVIDKEVRK